jgi:hypothetical protein
MLAGTRVCAPPGSYGRTSAPSRSLPLRIGARKMVLSKNFLETKNDGAPPPPQPMVERLRTRLRAIQELSDAGA